ncbi:MAG TPA: hypothetical protein VGD66_13990 [Allosphingosinicella sp.]|jgi:hypothetical protein
MNDAQTGAVPTRRSLLATVGMALIGVAATAARLPSGPLAGRAPSSGPAGRLPSSLKHASLAEWTSAVGQSFAVAGSAATLKLVAVDAFEAKGRRPASRPRGHGFAAVFEAGRAAPAGEGIHRLRHAIMAPLDVHFGAPIEVPGGFQLVAVFN